MARRAGDRFASAGLRARRVELGMKQDALARAIGVGVPMLSNIERGKSRASFARQAALATELQVDVDEVFGPVKPTADRNWVSVREAATIAHVSYETIMRAISNGELADEAGDDRRGGSPHRIPREALERWIATRAAAAELLSLNAAAARFAVCGDTLRAAAKGGGVPVESSFLDSRGRRHFRFSVGELATALDSLPVCTVEGCEERALHPCGGCSKHAAIIATPRGHSALTRQRISVASKEKPKTAEHRTALSLAAIGRPNPRKGQPLPPEWRATVSAGVANWWESPAGRARRDEMRARALSWSVVPCANCGHPVGKWRSQERRSARLKYRAFCNVCAPQWHSARLQARHAANGISNLQPLSKKSRVAFRRLVRICEGLETVGLTVWREHHDRGRPPLIAKTLAVETLYAWSRLSDPQILGLFKLEKPEWAGSTSRGIERLRHRVGLFERGPLATSQRRIKASRHRLTD